MDDKYKIITNGNHVEHSRQEFPLIKFERGKKYNGKKFICKYNNKS